MSSYSAALPYPNLAQVYSSALDSVTPSRHQHFNKMGNPPKPPANGFVSFMRKVYNPIGFSKGYNFILWFIFSGALFGFLLARAQYLNFYGIFCGPVQGPNHAGPGECFYYLRPSHERVGILLHLATIIPAGFLVLIQFIPIVRYKAIIVHRINGYVVLVLAFASVAGALMIARHAFGGGLDTQYGVGFLALVHVIALIMAYINIKRLQIEQHRAWMLRAWFYAGCIITIRIFQALTAIIITKIGDYWTTRPCDEIENTLGSYKAMLSLYPDCAPNANGTAPGAFVAVEANFYGNPVQIAAALGMAFGPAMWISLALHAIGVEIYLHLTTAETERLRNVSYQRQMEAGMRHPGSAGLVSDKFGDNVKWVANDEKEKKLAAGQSNEVSPDRT